MRTHSLRKALNKFAILVVGLFVTIFLVRLYSTPLRIDSFDTFTRGHLQATDKDVQKELVLQQNETHANYQEKRIKLKPKQQQSI
ncbi:uncharacterized protein Dvir_GJ26480, isoform A [Drosophila virilis]|uniref:Uncharacterized protein, isoform A n=1 Tax=Drosophila virilis TaxID=7244 RepID=A0A0Q9WKN4_DROVI|nr:uncharacterized protein Dvir_GJ26480, isoform A [Drosophila virilis]